MEEKTVFRMHELSSEYACRRRRNFGIQVDAPKENNFRKAAVIHEVLKKIVFGGISKEEAEAEIRKGLEKIPYHSKEREAHIKDAVREIYRYLDYETEQVISAVPADMNVGSGMIVRVNPTFIKADDRKKEISIWNGKKKVKDVTVDGTIEIVKVRTGKPVAVKSARTDIGLWAMLLYGRRFISPGQRAVVKASYYYLRHPDDSFGKGEFREFGDRNMVSLTELYEGEPNYMDDRFAFITEDFMNGRDEAELKSSDCEKCSYFFMCKGFSESPKASSDGIITRNASDVRFTDAQAEAVGY